MLTDHKEIKKWLDKNKIKKYTIRPDGVVDVDGDVRLYEFKGDRLPVQFGTVNGKFSFGDSPKISLEGVAEIIHGDLFCHACELKSYSGVGNLIKQIDGKFYGDVKTTHALSLVLIEQVIGGFGIDGEDDSPINVILNRYVGTGDILSAQDEFIDAGLIDQARL